jgi:hypothetical protein
MSHSGGGRDLLIIASSETIESQARRVPRAREQQSMRAVDKNPMLTVFRSFLPLAQALQVINSNNLYTLTGKEDVARLTK